MSLESARFKPMALYTKKGDTGTTKLFDCPPGTRIKKSEKIFEVLGTVDELNSQIGYAKALCKKEDLTLPSVKAKIPYTEILEKVQEHLFIIQAMLAGAKINIKPEHINYLENIIYEVETLIPPITSFVLPGGALAGSYLDVLRTVTRRVERGLVVLRDSKGKEIDEHPLAYTNRLSSLFYALARMANYQSGYTEKAPNYK